MSDNPNKKKADAKRASLQDHEIDYLKKKFNVSGQQVAGAVRAVGPSRTKVEKYLKDL